MILFLCACAEDPAALGGSDAGLALADAAILDVFDAGGALADSSIRDDAGSTTSEDASATVSDAGSVTSLCGDGYIDPGEVCDPGVVYPDGGVRIVADSARCHGCTVHDCSAYGAQAALEPASHRCVVRGTDGGGDPSSGRWSDASGLLWWEDTAERDRIIVAIRTGMLDGTVTSASGQIALRRFGYRPPSEPGIWYFYRADGTRLVAPGLPAWTERYPLSDPSYCARMTVTASGTTLTQIGCAATNTLTFHEPPGIPR